MILLVRVSFSFQSLPFFSIFLHISQAQAILPIGRPLSIGTSVFGVPVPIRSSVKLVIWKLIFGKNSFIEQSNVSRNVLFLSSKSSFKYYDNAEMG